MNPAPPLALDDLDGIVLPGGMPREPAFGLENERALRVGGHWPGEAAGDFLAHAVARQPANLRAHVQRIALAVDTADSEETWSALVDLYMALGPRGIELRRGMLYATRRLLPPGHELFLRERLLTGLAPHDPHPPAPGSMLTKGVTGTLHAVERTAGAAADRIDPLVDAREYLNEGNVTAAQHILEDALVANPARPDLAGDLLNIYWHARDAAGLRAMRLRLGDTLRGGAAWDQIEHDIARLERGHD